VDEEIPWLAEFRPRFYVGAFTLLIALGRLVFRAVHKRERPAPLAAPSGWLLAFVGCAGLSTLTAFEFGLALDTFKEWLTVLVGYFLIVTIVRTRRELLLTCLTLCLGAGVFVAWSFWEFKHGRAADAQGVPRMQGIGSSNSDPNSFAMTIVYALPLVIWIGAIARSWLLRVCALGYGVLTTVCVFCTSSRTALAVLAVNVVFMLVLLPGRRARWVAAGLVAVLVAATVPTLTDAQVKRIESMFSADTYEREKSTHDRLIAYGVAWRILGENPLVGVGPGNWSAYRSRKVDGDPLMPHSVGGQLIATLGGLGTLAFLGYLGSIVLFATKAFRRRWQSADPWERAVRRLAAVVVFELVLLIIAGLTSHNLERPNWVWMPALLVAAVACRPESVLDP
jgi:O-antigen ligase